MRRVLAFAVLAVAVAVLASPAAAATYSTSCPATDNACAALAERLEAGVAAQEANGVKLDTLHADLTATPGTTDIAGTVALSDDDAERLDLAAWGVWFLAGITCCLLFSQLWHRAWGFWR